MAFLDLMAFKEELACSTCLRYLTKPIAVECGHKFCFECLFQSWKEIPGQGTYHQCKDIYKLKDPRYSLQLGMMAELAKTLRPHLMDVKNSLCSIHEEKAKSFCVEDQVLLCEVCFLFLEHQSHVVLTTGEKKEASKAPSSSLRKHQPRINFPKEVLKGLSMHQGWLERRRGFPVGITLDGETASPYLVVSPDLKSVVNKGVKQDVVGHQERFDYPAITGPRTSPLEYITGRWLWGEKNEWKIGICKASLGRKNASFCSRDLYLLKCVSHDQSYTFCTPNSLALVSHSNFATKNVGV